MSLARILKDRLIAVVRVDEPECLPATIQALQAGGVSIIELTLTIPHAIDWIGRLSQQFSQTCLIGAGTVLNRSDAEAVLKAGAQFLISPIVARDVLDVGKAAGVPVMLGGYTPTEVYQAWQAGADIVKLFPADNLGPAYIKALRGPFPKLPIMPTGGVGLQNIADFFKAGACCVGVGGSLVDTKLIQEGLFERLQKLAQKFREIADRGDLQLCCEPRN